MRSRWLLCAALALVAAGCSSSSSTTINTPSFTRLYVSNLTGSGTGLNIFAPPFSAGSMPAVSVPAGAASGLRGTGGIAVDAAGKLYAIGNGTNPSTITIYAPPITAASTPMTSIILPSSTNAYGLTLDPSGNIWVSDRAGTSSTIREYTPPFTNTSTPALTLTHAANGINDSAGLAFDAAGHLAVGEEVTNTLLIFNPPITGASVPAATITLDGHGEGVVFDGAGRVFSVNPQTDIQVFTPPFSNGQAESFHFGAINGFSIAPKFDASGNLWVANSGANTVVEYAPPFSASTVPAVTLTNGLSNPYGIAFGL
jgi:streptogramin lyase